MSHAELEANWDVVVVGAGPAGAICADQLARRGLRTLLVDKATFPRYKICGCCLNGAGVTVLSRLGLGQILCGLPTVPIERLLLASAGKQASLSLHTGGLIISREALDAALVDAARSAGVTVIEGVTAKLGGRHDGRQLVELSADGGTERVSARLVVAADGLRGSLLEHQVEFHRVTANDSRIGVGATMEIAPGAYRPGTIYMAVASGGYVGQVCLADGRLNLAAALDRHFVAECGTPAEAAQRIVTGAGLPWCAEWSGVRWHGTPPLTRRLTRVAVGPVFAIGDAGAYIEPFTGEGMTWAMQSGAALAELLSGGRARSTNDLAAAWNARHRQMLGRRMLVCKTISAALRWPRFTRLVLSALSKAPWLAAPAIRYVGSR